FPSSAAAVIFSLQQTHYNSHIFVTADPLQHPRHRHNRFDDICFSPLQRASDHDNNFAAAVLPPLQWSP
ncbi:hypothetical protein HAX54_022098, partial [Datura stramonium]|nr:hypothetical protein [Datura stramonium]